MLKASFVFSKYLPGLRNSLLIILLLICGNSHQALEKYTPDSYVNLDIEKLFQSQITFNPDYENYVNQELDELLKRRRFNGSVMVAHQGKAVYQRHMGFANFADQREFDVTNNVFQLASVGKQFTAMAIMILQEKGALEFDDEVNMHIPDFPYPNITIRHLLNHTSGLQNYMYLIEHYWKDDRLPNQNDLLQIFLDRTLPLNFTPGRRFSYSNTGYAFLALVVESITGQTFAKFVKDEIFDPLGMKHSFVFVPDQTVPESIIPLLSSGHERMGRHQRVIPFDNLDGIAGDKGVFSCLEDLLKWDNALSNNTLISEQTSISAFERGRLRNGYAINYGFGFRIRKEQENDIIYHNGWWRGFRTSYVRLPDNTLIVILNNTNSTLNGLDDQIRNIIRKSPYGIFPESDHLANGAISNPLNI
jgi:CubicO group peptidase (beta-lactamase class C family)